MEYIIVKQKHFKRPSNNEEMLLRVLILVTKCCLLLVERKPETYKNAIVDATVFRKQKHGAC